MIVSLNTSIKYIGFSLCTSFLVLLATSATPAEVLLPPEGLPPPDEVPEEILRTEIITEARSPIDGSPMTAGDYADLQEALQDPNDPRTLSPRVRHAIFLLQLRRGLKPIIPIIP